ncbi:MAG: hypothetical protein FJ405_00150 [Verrucomicrobia bacterium]|nr:hypothetical protein [Verrucomicrobiota bacterium]
MMRIAILAAAALVFAGCSNTRITNLTPSQQPRNDTGIYPVEVELTSNQQSMQHHTINPTVVVGDKTYPMRRTLKTQYRWEAAIPVARTQNEVTYHFKFDYSYNRFGAPGRDSKLSSPYQLRIE